MALTPSNMLELNISAPQFSLPEPLTSNTVSFQDVVGKKGTVVMFICNHCPYVIHYFRDIVDMANEYQSQGINFVGICSNDVENYPEDAPDKMSIVAKVLKLPFPYLYDEKQDVARAYDAAATPDFYVFDENHRLKYRGRMDESRPNSGIPVTGKDIKAAMDNLISGNPISDVQYPSVGCGIKWKK